MHISIYAYDLYIFYNMQYAYIICVYVYIYVHIYINIHIYKYTHGYICIYICIYSSVYMHLLQNYYIVFGPFHVPYESHVIW